MQIPSWDKRLFDLKLAAESHDYCDGVLGKLKQAGLALTELSTHLQGQFVASHLAYDVFLEGFRSSQDSWRSQGLPGMGRAAIGVGSDRPVAGWALPRMPHFPARWRGPSSIRGRSGPQDLSTRRSRNWAGAGCRFLRNLTRRASTSALSCIRVKTCTMA